MTIGDELDELDELARKRDQLRKNQVRNRQEVRSLKARMARRGRRIAHIAQRIRHLRRQRVEQSKRGRDFLIAQEGIRLSTYNDSAGHCTVCVGHLVSMAPCSGSKSYTRAECERMLAADVRPCEAAVRNAIHAPLKQHQKDALICFAFNVGTGGFTSSTLARRINAKASDAEIREAFLMWDIPDEILPRRRREVDLYLTGSYGAR